MSRRRTSRRWHVGDKVRVPWYGHDRATMVLGGWHRGVVVGIRGDHVLVQSHGHIADRPAYELRPLIHRRFGWQLEEAYRAGAQS